MGRGKSKQSVGQKSRRASASTRVALRAVEDGNGNRNLESMFLCRASAQSVLAGLRYCYCY